MAKKIPTWKEKQNLLYNPKRKGSPTKLIQYGQACVESKFYNDAFEYFHYADHQDGIQNLLAIAVENGDGFLIKKISHYYPSTIQKDDLSEAINNAKSQGKELFSQELQKLQEA